MQGTLIRQLQCDTGLDRKTIRRVLRGDARPRYARGAGSSKLDPFKDEIDRLLHDEQPLPNVRVGEVIAPLGYTGHQTILDAYPREVRPLFGPPVRTYRPSARHND